MTYQDLVAGVKALTESSPTLEAEELDRAFLHLVNTFADDPETSPEDLILAESYLITATNRILSRINEEIRQIRQVLNTPVDPNGTVN